MEDNIFNRRSVRQFDERPVEPEKIERLLRAAMQAPSAGNQRPWQFIVVQERQARAELALMSPYAGPVANAPCSVVLLGDEKRFKFPDFWPQDLAAAAENLLLEAVVQGLGSVWLGVWPLRERVEAIRRQFALPASLFPFAVIAVGYPAGPGANRFVDRWEADRVHKERLQPSTAPVDSTDR